MSMSVNYNGYTLEMSDNGYLVFQSVEDVQHYFDYVLSHNISEIITLHNNLGFVPLAGNNQNIDKENYPELLSFNSNGLIQIGNNVIKLTDNKEFLLTINSNALNSQEYSNLISESFNINTMNKLSILKVRNDNNFNIIDVINNNPNGIDESNDEVQPLRGRPCFGTREFKMPCNEYTGQRWVNVVHYVLWIGAWETGYFEPC